MTRREFVGGVLVAAGGAAAKVPASSACPKSKAPARNLYAIRLAELTSYSFDMRLALTCLQGIVNRTQPRLYLAHDRYDELWLDWLCERGDVDHVHWLETTEVFARFLPEIKAAFLIDPEIPASVNVATMLASLHQGIAITPKTARQYDLPMGRLPDSWNTGMDLSAMGWKKDVEAYRWAYEKFGAHLSEQAMAFLAPDEIPLRDYAVEFALPILWISGPKDVKTNPAASPEEEKRFFRDLLLKWPPNIACFGWPGSGDSPQGGIGEWEGVRLLSECAKYTVVSANDGYSPGVGNLSVHSGTSATLRQPRTGPIEPAPNKVYVCFSGTDGDGPNFLRHIYRKLHDQTRQPGPSIAWQLSPAEFDVMPDLLDFYYKKAHPGDTFAASMTGLGYIHEDVYADAYPKADRDDILRDYIERSGQYCAHLDTSVLVTFAEMSPERLQRFAAMPNIQAVLANYARTHVTTAQNLLTEAGGVPVFRAVNHLPGDFVATPNAEEDAESFMAEQIQRWTPADRPALMYVFLAYWFTNRKMLTDIMKRLGKDYVAVSPGQLLSLHSQVKQL